MFIHVEIALGFRVHRTSARPLGHAVLVGT